MASVGGRRFTGQELDSVLWAALRGVVWLHARTRAFPSRTRGYLCLHVLHTCSTSHSPVGSRALHSGIRAERPLGVWKAGVTGCGGGSWGGGSSAEVPLCLGPWEAVVVTGRGPREGRGGRGLRPEVTGARKEVRGVVAVRRNPCLQIVKFCWR